VEAVLLPLMGRRRPLPDLLAEVAEASGVLPPSERVEVLRKLSAFEELLADYIIKSRTQGIAEGRAGGKQEAVLEILGKRFGAVPEALSGEIAAVHDPDRLTALLDAALDAESLDAFARTLRGASTRT
jgi:hypothetical protein